MMNRTRRYTASGSKTVTKTGNQLNNDWLWRQYVSEPLAAQTISGTVKGQMRVQEANAAANARAQMIVRVVSNDGSTVRGTLYDGDLETLTGDPTSEYGTSLTNRKFPRGGAATLTSVTAEEGDRIVVELGTRIHSTETTSRVLTVSFTDSGTSADLAEDETTTSSAQRTWVEFSQDIAESPQNITVVSAATTTSGSSTSYTLNRPSSVTDGDLMVMAIISEVDSGSISVPSGWTTRWSGTWMATNRPFLVAFRVITDIGSEPTSYTASKSSGTARGMILAYRGVDPDNPFDIATDTTNSATATTLSVPAVTTVTGGAWLLAIGGIAANTNQAGSASTVGYAVRGYVNGVTSSVGMWTAEKWVAGGSGSPGIVWSSASSVARFAILTALRPAPAGEEPEPVTLETAAAISGDSAITSAASSRKATSAAVSGAGATAAGATVSEAVAASMQGVGVITIATTVHGVYPAAATVLGAGNTTIGSAITKRSSTALASEAAVSIHPAIVWGTAAAMSGVGSITAAQRIAKRTTGTATGSSSAIASANIRVTTTGSAAGTSTSAANAATSMVAAGTAAGLAEAQAEARLALLVSATASGGSVVDDAATLLAMVATGTASGVATATAFVTVPVPLLAGISWSIVNEPIGMSFVPGADTIGIQAVILTNGMSASVIAGQDDLAVNVAVAAESVGMELTPGGEPVLIGIGSGGEGIDVLTAIEGIG